MEEVDLEKLLVMDKKDKNQEVVYQLNLGSKVDKLHFIEESLKEDLIMQDSELNLLQSI